MYFDMKDLTFATRSYRAFDQSVKVMKEELLELVDIARLTGCAKNSQVLKYRLVEDSDEVEGMISQVRWAGKLNIQLPPEGKHPGAFIVICHDTAVEAESQLFMIDVGIAAQTILLSATEIGLGGCMFYSFQSDKLAEFLALPEGIVPKLVIALGKPDETVILTAPGKNGDLSYFRDTAGVHYVPKRTLSDILIEKK